jgi:hypothetical protein
MGDVNRPDTGQGRKAVSDVRRRSGRDGRPMGAERAGHSRGLNVNTWGATMIPNSKRTQRAIQAHPDGADATGNGDWDRLERWVQSVDRRLSTTTRKRLGGDGVNRYAGRLSSAAVSGGSGPGNTDPPTLHLGGLDWLDLTVYGRSKGDLKHTIGRLLALREQLRQDKEKDGIAYLGPLAGVLKSNGTGRGYSHQPLTWVHKGIKFRFGGKDGQCLSTEEQLLVFVDVTGDPFLCLGESTVFHIIRHVLKLLGIEVTRIRVRRIDACVDMADVDVRQFSDAIERGNFIARAAKPVNVHYGRDGESTGFTVQGLACSLNVYDKIKETEGQGKEEKRAWLMAYRWGGRVPEKATRVEFRIRPDLCEWAEFRSLGDLLEALKRVFGWAAEAWFRLCEVKDRRHTERAKMLSIWRDVIASFSCLCDSFDGLVEPRRPQPVAVERLAKSALGTLATAVAACGLESGAMRWHDIFMRLLGEPPDRSIYRQEWEHKVTIKLVERPNVLTG